MGSFPESYDSKSPTFQRGGGERRLAYKKDWKARPNIRIKPLKSWLRLRLRL